MDAANSNLASNFDSRIDLTFNWRYYIFDPDIKALTSSSKIADGLIEYQDHCRKRESYLSTFIWFNFVPVGLSLYRQYVLLKFSTQSPLIIANVLFVFVTLVLSSLIYVALKIFPRYASKSLLDVIEITWVIGIYSYFCSIMVVKVGGGECLNGDKYSYFECNTFLPFKKVPEDLIILLLLLPGMVSVMMKRVPWSVLLIIYAIGIIILLICIFGYGNYSSGRSFFGTLPMALVALCEYRRMNIDMYLLSMSQIMLMNKIKLDADASAESLRYMLSNVAHDLKTVLILLIY